jgi:uncharacterized protein YndB with AHSA1/START domain
MSSTNTQHRNETRIVVDPNVPTIEIIREFDAPPERVYRAHTDPDLVSKWLGPKDTSMRIESWDARTGGSWRYVAIRDGEDIASFYGSFHELRPDERIVQTFTYEGVPDGVSLETATFEDLGGRTRLSVKSVVDTFEGRDAIVASGMDHGVREGYERLDDMLAEG